MSNFPIYPLKLKPVFKYKLWGGRRLSEFLSFPLPSGTLTGEAWLLSNEGEVIEGELQGQTIETLVRDHPDELLGQASGRYRSFPFVIKFTDAQTRPSIQVHPADELAEYVPPGETGKTEAWVVLKTGPKNRIYAGLKAGSTREKVAELLESHRVEEALYSFVPSPGDAVFLKPGTLHNLEDLVVLGIEQNSDITFRLYDWDRVDAATGKRRELQVSEAMACIDFSQGSVKAIEPVIETASPVMREKLFDCTHFRLWRIQAENPFQVGEEKLPRAVVCLEGKGYLDCKGSLFPVEKGDVFLLPASMGVCTFRPEDKVILFEAGLSAS